MNIEQTLIVTEIMKTETVLSIVDDEEHAIGLNLSHGRYVFVTVEGGQHWYLNDQCHREDGPAVIWPNGTQLWWLNDQRHRKDGPAEIWANGERFWYLNDSYLSEEDWKKLTEQA